VTQVFIALFGLSALWMAMGKSERQRKWAPVLGLAGQPFWAAFAWQTGGWGLGILVSAYTVVYARGVWVQWGASVWPVARFVTVILAVVVAVSLVLGAAAAGLGAVKSASDAIPGIFSSTTGALR
jgi:hypothetical protein